MYKELVTSVNLASQTHCPHCPEMTDTGHLAEHIMVEVELNVEEPDVGFIAKCLKLMMIFINVGEVKSQRHNRKIR